MRIAPDAEPQVPDEILAIVRTLEDLGFEAWCVGGALRDFLLGRPQADYDVATSAEPSVVRRAFRRTVPVGERFGTIGVLDASGVLHEVTTFRHDVQTDGRHAEVAFGASLDDDLARRDFTINALAFHPIRKEWKDPFDGRRDLASGCVRAVGDPAARFREDYLRILRSLRFAARLGFNIESQTWTALTEAAEGLRRISHERVRDEWFKSLATAGSVGTLVDLWHRSGAAAAVLPELIGADAVPSTLDAAPRDPVLLTILLCENAPGVLHRLRCSNAEVARAEAVGRSGAPPADGSDEAVRQWLSARADVADDHLRIWRLQHGVGAPWEDTVRAIRDRGDPLTRADLAIDGADLMRLGYEREAIGEALDRAVQLVLRDPSLNERAALLEQLGRRL